MKFKSLSEAFTHAINGKNKPLEGRIIQAGIDRLCNDFYVDTYGSDNFVEESLRRNSSLQYHYRKHVLRQDEERRSYNRLKYDFMSPQEYYEHAKNISEQEPDFLIDESILDVAEAELIADNFINNGGCFKIDYNLVNQSDNKPIFAVFKKQNNSIELCLVDKQTAEPVTCFLITNSKFYRYINDFLTN